MCNNMIDKRHDVVIEWDVGTIMLIIKLMLTIKLIIKLKITINLLDNCTRVATHLDFQSGSVGDGSVCACGCGCGWTDG